MLRVIRGSLAARAVMAYFHLALRLEHPNLTVMALRWVLSRPFICSTVRNCLTTAQKPGWCPYFQGRSAHRRGQCPQAAHTSTEPSTEAGTRTKQLLRVFTSQVCPTLPQEHLRREHSNEVGRRRTPRHLSLSDTVNRNIAAEPARVL